MQNGRGLPILARHERWKRRRRLVLSPPADREAERSVDEPPKTMNHVRISKIILNLGSGYNTIIVVVVQMLIPYSRKYWRELKFNLVVKPKIAIARIIILADLNLAVRYGIAICIHASRKFWWILIWRL